MTDSGQESDPSLDGERLETWASLIVTLFVTLFQFSSTDPKEAENPHIWQCLPAL
jgi:hypothetical protein